MRASLIVALIPFAGCATYWQASSLEEKVDRLIENTNRNTLSQIFGEQAGAIGEKMEGLSGEQRERLDELLSEYQRGSSSLEEVRASVLGVMGGSDRVVSSAQGIWVRNEEGKRLMAISRNTKIKGCEPLSDEEVPAAIANNRGLSGYRWGRGEVDGKTILFPWELTMSSFAREIVEHTARRTAQRVLEMAGDKGWRRPVYIQVITEPGKNMRVNTPGTESEVYVVPEGQQPPAEGEPPAEAE